MGYRVRQQRSPGGVHQAIILPTVSRYCRYCRQIQIILVDGCSIKRRSQDIVQDSNTVAVCVQTIHTILSDIAEYLFKFIGERNIWNTFFAALTLLRRPRMTPPSDCHGVQSRGGSRQARCRLLVWSAISTLYPSLHTVPQIIELQTKVLEGYEKILTIKTLC